MKGKCPEINSIVFKLSVQFLQYACKNLELIKSQNTTILKYIPKRNRESTHIELPLAFHSQSAVSHEKLVMDGKVLYLICAK